MDKVSSTLLAYIDTVAIITVLQLPPSESFNKVVSKEFLYGICCFVLDFDFWFSATMTCSRYVSDKLIDFAYTKTIPSACDFEILYEPAKSTKWIFEYTSARVALSVPRIFKVNIQCEREEAWFKDVAFIFLL